ncbi:hypothetical protein FMEAI12_5100018 [Parafrankia sp. Ea1.12]|nr:hypothetical protein FMEAI12_5100018 [Parafrankia sp. Ea1.12]
MGHMRWSDRWDSETFLMLGPATFTLPAAPRRRLAALCRPGTGAAGTRRPARAVGPSPGGRSSPPVDLDCHGAQARNFDSSIPPINRQSEGEGDRGEHERPDSGEYR